MARVCEDEPSSIILIIVTIFCKHTHTHTHTHRLAGVCQDGRSSTTRVLAPPPPKRRRQKKNIPSQVSPIDVRLLDADILGVYCLSGVLFQSPASPDGLCLGRCRKWRGLCVFVERGREGGRERERKMAFVSRCGRRGQVKEGDARVKGGAEVRPVERQKKVYL